MHLASFSIIHVLDLQTMYWYSLISIASEEKIIKDTYKFEHFDRCNHRAVYTLNDIKDFTASYFIVIYEGRYMQCGLIRDLQSRTRIEYRFVWPKVSMS